MRDAPAAPVVLDTNVLVAGLRSPHGASFRLLELLQQNRLRPAVSVPLVLEYEAVLLRHLPQLGLSQAQLHAFLDYLCARSQHTTIHYLWRPHAKDAGDDLVLEVALAAQAQAIVTFNTRDLQPAAQLGIEVLTPQQWLQQLSEEPPCLP